MLKTILLYPRTSSRIKLFIGDEISIADGRFYDGAMDSVKKVTQEIYYRIDNDLYHAEGDRWRIDQEKTPCSIH